MNKPFFLLAPIAILATSGCVHLDASAYLTGSRRPATSSAPTVVLEGAETPAGLEEIGILQVQCSGRCDMPMAMGRLQDEARALGATHVVHVRMDQGASMLVVHGVAAASGAPATYAGTPFQ